MKDLVIIDPTFSFFLTFCSCFRCYLQSLPPRKIALFIEEPALQISVKSTTPLADVGGWVGALHEKEFDNYYEQNIKSIYENGKPNILSQKKLIPTVYAYSNSPITDFDMENEMINKNKEVTQTENYKRKNSNKDIVDNDLVLGEDERHLLKTTQGVIVQNVRVCNGHGGVMICRMGQIWIEKSVFCNLSYGVRCLQSSRCVFFQNRFYNCETTGVFLKDHSVGFIAGNEIYENTEAGSSSSHSTFLWQTLHKK